MATHLLRKYKDKVGRIVSSFKDNQSKEYIINISHFDAYGNSLLKNGVAMVSYSFKSKKAYLDALSRLPREKDLK